MATRFTALKNFWCPQTQSEYCAGLVYTVNDGTVLHEMMPSLVKAGKVQVLSENAKPRAQIRGQAIVTDEPTPPQGFFDKVKEVFSWR